MKSCIFSLLILLSVATVAQAQPDEVKKGTLYLGAGMQVANIQQHFEKGETVVLEVAAESPLKSVALLSAPGFISARRSGVELVRMEYQVEESGNLEFRFEPVLNGSRNVVNYRITTLPVAAPAAAITASGE